MESYCRWCHQANDPLSEQHRNPPKAMTCPQCQHEITLITIRKACELVGVSKTTIYTWIDRGLVSTVRTASGRLLICLSSLFLPSDQGNNDALREQAKHLTKKSETVKFRKIQLIDTLEVMSYSAARAQKKVHERRSYASQALDSVAFERGPDRCSRNILGRVRSHLSSGRILTSDFRGWSFEAGHTNMPLPDKMGRLRLRNSTMNAD